MKILILGGDGYLGWPQALYLSHNHDVFIVDNFSRRLIDMRMGLNSLTSISSLQGRTELWYDITGQDIIICPADVSHYGEMSEIIGRIKPDVIVHFAEQRSAPYSMIDHSHAAYTMRNNVFGTLNILYAMREHVPMCHLVKLGTMGEYGTPNIDIEEGFLEVEHKGRKDVLPYPKQPGSFYHLTKVHDSNNIMFCCRTWGLRCTDLNQGVVYGHETDETDIADELATRFDYDHIYGTVLNRFVCQAVCDYPLTVYGNGTQTRGYINIRDTIKCIDLAIKNPPALGEYRVFNQITETFSVRELADRISVLAGGEIQCIDNPRIEKENHYYNVAHTKLVDLGLEPHLLTDNYLAELIDFVALQKERINPDLFYPMVKWA